MTMVHCRECGKQISNMAQACPSCGCPVTTPTESGQTLNGVKKRNTLALAGFVTGLASLILNFFGIVGMGAAILSGIALGKFNNETENNKWMAVVGLILGCIGMIWGLVVMFEYF